MRLSGSEITCKRRLGSDVFMSSVRNDNAIAACYFLRYTKSLHQTETTKDLDNCTHYFILWTCNYDPLSINHPFITKLKLHYASSKFNCQHVNFDCVRYF